MSFSTPQDTGVHFFVLPLKADGSPGDFQGAPLSVSNVIPGIVTASFETDGRLKVVPIQVGTATLIVEATVAGVTIRGTLTIAITAPNAPPPPDDATTSIGFAIADTFPNPPVTPPAGS